MRSDMQNSTFNVEASKVIHSMAAPESVSLEFLTKLEQLGDLDPPLGLCLTE